MAINIKFTKFDNTPWGFRLAGGSDFPQPLTVIKVNEGSLAECMGIKVGDVVVRLNDQPISSLTHGQAHEALKLAGNNFVLGVQREEEARKALEAIPDENIVPYNISLADLPPVFPEKILSEDTILEKHEVTIERLPTPDKAEELPDKPKDANSEIIPNQNLTDEEIAQLILEEEELLPYKGVLGVNFNKPKPRATVLKSSKVLEELQHIAAAPPPDVEERHHISTFLKKPDRPIPKAKPREPSEGEPYRVVIKKQSKKSVIARLVEKGLIPPGSLDTPEPTSEVKMYAPEESNEESNEIGTAVHEIDVPKLLLPNSIRSNDFPDPIEKPTLDLVSVKTLTTNPNPPTCLPSLTLRRSTIKPKRLYTRARYFERSLLGYRKDSDRVTLAYLLELILGKSSPNGTFGRIRRRGRYIETYLEREDIWFKSMFKVFFAKRNDITKGRRFSKPRYAERLLTRNFLRGEFVERRNTAKMQKRRLCPKARYFERVLAKDVRRLIELIKEISIRVDLGKFFIGSNEREIRQGARRRSSLIKVKGHYLERCLARQDSSAIVSTLTSTLTGLIESTKRRSSEVADGQLDVSVKARSRRCSYDRAHYGERAIVRNLEILGNLAEKMTSKILGWREGRPTNDDLEVSLSNSISYEEEGGGFSKFLRSTGEFVSAEVFHRGGRRLSRSSKVVKVDSPMESNGWLGLLARLCGLDNGARFSDDSLKTCDEKIAREADYEARRLSFVPTVLYKGLTNHIGVDFTRLVAYTFVPCASVVLLYMYK
ncbi:uncharacterized protein LOC124423898 isoform X1 [Vespa crabro]|uniref:uncharacterized protein LOC124423898 isoform X1 n=2 Tax=Vespa crabro TaxID=7445 RepID=UPI001F024CB2|nr:uncharacterized protein LOC124423898 isoform X1 [Vespa crabro]XP_046818195.1 uncharacterized protein LOC124423898 isoform X1 [Vespa crabro]XP_046818196.1 uncharacterized protein LOC124423898 isoform X1 [Vespa crabro]XP_046818197.1 uncharacterized protein LOC124423898 isoform X1 [Vespa crabro]